MLRYFTPSIEIKGFNLLIDSKSWFDDPIKKRSKWKDYWNEQSNDLTSGNSLDYEYFLKHYKLIAIDLSTVKIANLEEMKEQQCFSLKSQKKLLLNFHKFCEYHIK